MLAALIVTSLGAGLCFAPALTLLSDTAESSRLHQGFAAGLSNMAWASGQVVGGIGGGVVASLTGNAVPSIAIAALLLVTVAYAFRSPGADRAVRRGRAATARLARWLGASGGAPASWRNWAGDQSCRPAEIVRPRDREELAEAVAAAAAAGRKVSVAGSGHSFTEAALTDGTMIADRGAAAG